MAKRFEFINNNSDVYVVGNSQLAGFKGISKDKDRAMNVSMCRGAQIQDCLTECDKRYRLKKNKMVLIHGLQHSVMDIKNREINLYKDVLEVVEKLNKNKNGNVFILCQTDYSPKQTEVEGLRPTIEWINRKVDQCNRKSGFDSPKPWMAVTEICRDGRLYQKAGAWRERGRLGYHVSDLYKPVYEQQFFLFFKDLPAAKISSAKKHTSKGQDLRQLIRQKKTQLPARKERKTLGSEKELQLRDRSRSPLRSDKDTRAIPGTSGSKVIQVTNTTFSNCTVQLTTN